MFCHSEKKPSREEEIATEPGLVVHHPAWQHDLLGLHGLEANGRADTLGLQHRTQIGDNDSLGLSMISRRQTAFLFDQ